MLYPKLQPTKNNTFELLEDYNYTFNGTVFTVPKGYQTNGSDIPRMFWSWIPPFKPKYLPAVVVHDYYCSEKQYKLADNLFEAILLEIEDSFKTRTMVRAVRFYSKYIR